MIEYIRRVKKNITFGFFVTIEFIYLCKYFLWRSWRLYFTREFVPSFSLAVQNFFPKIRNRRSEFCGCIECFICIIYLLFLFFDCPKSFESFVPPRFVCVIGIFNCFLCFWMWALSQTSQYSSSLLNLIKVALLLFFLKE